MNARARMPVRKSETSPYADREDFTGIFTESLNGLYQLSFLLTGDEKKAEKCLVSGIEDCVNGNPVFKEWARSWAKRVIIELAIREFEPRPSHSRTSPPRTRSSHARQSSGTDEHFAVGAVLELEDFERFVFVMSVLERYSPHECSLLLGCTILEVREARRRALENLAAARHVDLFTRELSASRR